MPSQPINIVFPTSSTPGVMPQESGGRLINAYIEKAPTGAPSTIIHRRSPGMQRMAQVTTTGVQHTRGFLDAGGVLLWAMDNQLYSVNSSYGVTSLGGLAGTQPVTFARNNALPNNLVVVTENGCFNVFTGSPPTAFADPDLPSSPTSVCDYDGYFVWTYGNGQVFASDLNAVTVNALSFNTEQGLFARRAVRYAGRLYIFGDKWTGVYTDAGTIPFPFARETTIPRGIVSTNAVAGWEYGWANQLLWAGDDFIVYNLNGYTPVPISINAVSRDIRTSVLAGKRNLIQAYVYMYERNPIWGITCIDDFTWEYNLATGEWNERMSYNRGAWKGVKSIRIYDQWLVGDQYDGELYSLTGSYFLEGTDPLIWQVESGTLLQFPRGVDVPRASFHITAAIGDLDVVPDPKVEISWSMDGGYSYGEPVIRRMGGPGQSESYPYVMRCGLSKGQGIRFKLRVSDPVHVGLNGGVIEGEPRLFAG